MIWVFRYKIIMASVLNDTMEKANAAYQEGRLQDAERLYRVILKEHPYHSQANFSLGQTSVAAGHPNESLRFFETALQHDPNPLQFWQGYVDALLRCSRFDQARGAAQKMRGFGFDGQSCDRLDQNIAERQAK